MHFLQTFYVNTYTIELRRLGQLFYPYFGFSGDNLKRALAALVIVASAFTTALSMVYIQNSFTALNLILLQPGITTAALSAGIVKCLIPVCIYAGFFSISWGMAEWLASNLNHQLSQNLISKWIDDKSFYGIKFIDKKGKRINPSVVLQADIGQIAYAGPTLGSSLIRTTLDFVVGVQQLWVLSAPLIITLFSYSFAVPAYMVLIAVPYSAVYSFIITLLDGNLKKIEAKLKSKNDKFVAHLHHVEENAEAIALKRGGKKEKEQLLKNLGKVTSIQHQRQWIGSVINFSQNIIMNLSYMFGLLLAAPGINAGMLDGSNAFSVANYFTSVVNFFTWKKNNNTIMVDLTVALDRFDLFQGLMQQWDTIQASNELIVNKEAKIFNIKNLSVTTPDGTPIFKQLSFKLPNGEAIVIQGSSGVGKTTLFRCLAGLWPYAKGEVTLPCGKKGRIHYIPQQPYFPLQSTLLEAINYPDDGQLPIKKKKFVVQLMKELGFKEEAIAALEQRDEWHKRLSGGEQQRIAVIGAIMKKPAILFMDEATNALDPETKQLCENALKIHLKNTTIVGIDHQSEPMENIPFFDHHLELKKTQQLHRKRASLSLSAHLTDTACKRGEAEPLGLRSKIKAVK